MFGIKIIVLLYSCFLSMPLMASGDTIKLQQLEQAFQQNPNNATLAIELLDELENIKGSEYKSDSILNIYFSTQKECDYLKSYNWTIVKEFVDDIRSPYLRYVFQNREQYAQCYSKDDVYQKLDDALVNHLEPYYASSKSTFLKKMEHLKAEGYQHVDVVSDYFLIRELNKKEFAEDYFYKARKLFRYFPENRVLIKKITADAITIIDDVSHLKVIQLWAGKTVESHYDFEAYSNYALISKKCGYIDLARDYVLKMKKIVQKMGDQKLIEQVSKLDLQIG